MNKCSLKQYVIDDLQLGFAQNESAWHTDRLRSHGDLNRACAAVQTGSFEEAKLTIRKGQEPRRFDLKCALAPRLLPLFFCAFAPKLGFGGGGFCSGSLSLSQVLRYGKSGTYHSATARGP